MGHSHQQDHTNSTHPTSSRIRFTAILCSLIGGLLILALKLYAAKIANSSALRSDALEGTVNVLAAAFGLGSILFSEKPADQDHPYGHGKIEYFAQAFEGGLISLAGFLIVIDTLSRLSHQVEMDQLSLGLKLSVIAGGLNGVMGLLIYLAGKKHQSQILIADGIHLLSDLVTTVVLAAGLILAIVTGYAWLDPLLAFGVAIFLLRTGFILVHESSKALLDAENPLLTEKIVEYLNEIPRHHVITAHEMRAQEFGRDKHVDIHVVVPEFMSIKEAHGLIDNYALKLSEKLGHGSVVHTHVDPCGRNYCRECSILECPIRQQDFEKMLPFTRESIIKPGKE